MIIIYINFCGYFRLALADERHLYANLNIVRYDNLDDALGSIKPVYKKVLTVSTNLATGGEGALITTPIGAVEDDDLWCTHCMDDPAVAVCAFCGCRVRYAYIQSLMRADCTPTYFLC